MGCCLSRHAVPTPTSTAEEEEETQQLHHAHTNESSIAPVRVAPALSDRYNRLLVRHPPWSSKKPATPAQLRAAREEFWETRVTGRSEIWGALRAAVELLEVDLETAQGIIDAAGINVPSGDIAKGAYDERGLRYEVPDYCFGDPVNVVPEAEAAGREVPVPLHEDESEPEDEDLGKGKMPVGKEFSVRARLSDRGGPDAVIKFHETDLVRRLADMVAEKSQIPQGTRISIMYLGKILDENETLLAQGWKKGNVVNALVRCR